MPGFMVLNMCKLLLLLLLLILTITQRFTETAKTAMTITKGRRMLKQVLRGLRLTVLRVLLTTV